MPESCAIAGGDTGRTASLPAAAAAAAARVGAMEVEEEVEQAKECERVDAGGEVEEVDREDAVGMEAVCAWVRAHWAHAELLEAFETRLIFRIPRTDVLSLADAFSLLETRSFPFPASLFANLMLCLHSCLHCHHSLY